MDAEFLRTGEFVESYRMMRIKKFECNIGTDFGEDVIQNPRPSDLEICVIMSHAKNTFLSIYDPLESI